MLEEIKLEYVGPAPSMELLFQPRLNILTGDNGLGKTFALDIAWWILSGTWAEQPAMPHRGRGSESRIDCWVTEKGVEKPQRFTSLYDPNTNYWPRPPAWSAMTPCLVIYLRTDGGVTVWDPARNSTRSSGPNGWQTSNESLPPAFLFSQSDVWNGFSENGQILCNGLVRDWVNWQLKDNEAFRILKEVLALLSPGGRARLLPGEPTRTRVGDVREIPTIRMPYGTVPITHVSAGMRRIVSLAYAIVWTWTEHQEAVELVGRPPEDRVLILWDEIEAHLHPEWQRTILPSVMRISELLSDEVRLQVISSTHSPLVLASVETRFDEGKDAVLCFDIDDGAVSLRNLDWSKQGDAANWLTSEVFGLTQARSVEAEVAIETAEAFMRGAQDLPEDFSSAEDIHRELCRVLPAHDPFWPRWVVKRDEAGA